MFKLIYPQFWQVTGWLSYCLWPLSKIYFLLSKLRQIIIKPKLVNARIICVGNITVGGTGKTQVVIWLAKSLTAKGISFVIITKGYGSKLKKPTLVTKNHKASEVGDEAVILNNYGLVIAAKKPSLAINLITKLKAQVVIMDDGMQNPDIYKDFTILTIDGQRGFGNEQLLPAGPLRENLSSGFDKCAAVIIIDPDDKLSLAHRIKHYQKPIFTARITIICDNFDKTKNYYAFSGIGNPEKFFATLSKAGFKLTAKKIFQDHHHYSTKDMSCLIAEAQRYNATLITTTKDYTKILPKFNDVSQHAKQNLAQGVSIICVATKLTIDNEPKLSELIDETLRY